MKKLLIYPICVIIFLRVDALFAFDAGKTESYLDQISRGHIDYKQYEEPLNEAINQINEELVNNEEDPYLWYLKGRSSFAALKIHGALYGRKDADYKMLQEHIPVEFKKALALNKDIKVLTGGQLMNMLGSDWIWTEAARQYIGLKQSQGRLDEKEHLELLQDRVVSGLIRQNKFEEALLELDHIDELFPDNAEGPRGNKAWRDYYNKEIEKQKAKLKAEEEKRLAAEKKEEPTITEPPKPVEESPTPADPSPQPDPEPAVKPEQTPKPESTPDNAGIDYRMVVGLLLVILILVGFLWRRNR